MFQSRDEGAKTLLGTTQTSQSVLQYSGSELSSTILSGPLSTRGRARQPRVRVSPWMEHSLWFIIRAVGPDPSKRRLEENHT
jgi:hypothetical protein